MKPRQQLLTLLAALSLCCASALVAHAAPPNILLLVAEDLSPRLGATGDRLAATPQIDALARRSVHYTHAFTTAGVCAPSRAALITGQHQISFGAQHMRTSTGPLGAYLAQPAIDVKAFPELLRRAGYYTFTDTKLDYQFSGVRAGSGPFTVWDAEGAGTDWRGRAPGQPFFGLINFMQTHESGIMATSGPPVNTSHAATMRWRAAGGLHAPAVTSPAAVTLPPYYPDLPAVRSDLARHYDNIRALDAQVGAWLQQLVNAGLADNTIVIFTTDHGDGLPRAKRELFDSGIHVPLFLHLPPTVAADYSAHQQGTTDSRLVSFVDLAPTVLQLAGVAPPTYLHGISLLPGNTRRRYVFASRDRIDEVDDRQRAVRDRHFKYIRSYRPHVAGGHELAYRDILASSRALRDAHLAGRLTAAQERWYEPPGEHQLYDLRADPHELHNLAADPRSRRQLRRLQRALQRWQQRVPDTAEQPEAAMRTRFLTAAGDVPTTPEPGVARDAQGRIVCTAIPGASIGYQVNGGKWQLYTQPLALFPTPVTLAVRAVRYGWQASSVRTVEPAQY